MQKHPRALPILASLEFWDRFSYYGIQAVLVLFLVKVMYNPVTNTYLSYGIYTTLGFATPVLGGYLADRFLGFNRAIIFGSILIILGNALLAYSTISNLYLGISCTLLGIGFYKPSTASLLGRLYHDNPDNREAGFSIFYMGMTAGSVVGPSIYGLLTNGNWHAGFLISALGMLALFLVYLFNRKPSSKASARATTLVAVLAAVLVYASYQLFLHPAVFNLVILIGIIIIIAHIVSIIRQQEAAARAKLKALVILTCFAIFFYVGEVQFASSILLYVGHHVHHALWGWVIPLPFFAALYSLFVIFLTPATSKFWTYLSKKSASAAVYRVKLGLLMCLLCFAVLYALSVSTHTSNINYPLAGIILASLFIGFGDLCITPTLTSAVTYLAPKQLNGRFMGIWFLSIALSGFIGAKISANISTLYESSQHTNPWLFHSSFTLIFLCIALLSLIFLVLLYLLHGKLHQWITRN